MSEVAPRDRLYELLPALYRIRDHEQGHPLQALLRVVEDKLDRIDADIAQLYDNWFIETCAEWVVPYIGDLLRVRGIRPVESAGVTTRAYVANTLAYRRRKGTAVVLEQLARDITGWPARAVEFFARLATTEHMNHVRALPTATPSLRAARVAELTDTAFDRFAHTAEVRRIASGRGRYNIPNVGLFLWRSQSYPIGRDDGAGMLTDFSTAREVARPGFPPRSWYTFHPVGLDAPLFNNPQTEETITHLADEENVPGVLRRLALQQELDAVRGASTGSPGPLPSELLDLLRFMRDDAPAFRILVQMLPGGPRVAVPREQIYMCEIPDEVENASPPAPLAVAVDPERGRLALTSGLMPHAVFVTSSYGAPGDLGGGPYNRSGTIDENEFARPTVWQSGVSHLPTTGPGPVFSSLADAVAAWHAMPAGSTGVIVLMDSLTESLTGTPGDVEIVVPGNSSLLIAAGDWPLEDDPEAPGAPRRFPGTFTLDGVRPHLVGNLRVHGEPPASGGQPGRLTINGVLLEGSLTIATGDLGSLQLSHSTIVPGRGVLSVDGGNDRLTIMIQRSIVAAIDVPDPIDLVSLEDCLVSDRQIGSPEALVYVPASRVAVQRTTVFGRVEAEVLDASDSIFTAPARAARRQLGCVRFCYVPRGSAVARRYRCQPDLERAAAIAAARDVAAQAGTPLTPVAEQAVADQAARGVVPLFDARQYGDPEFGQLSRRCALQIRAGADNGSEMGAFNFLMAPQREANLRGALDEYLRFGLEAGLFFVSLTRRKEHDER